MDDYTAAWVRAARAKAGLTLEQLGELVGRTKANVGHWEKGKHAPSYAQMLAISKVTGHPMPAGGDLAYEDPTGVVTHLEVKGSATAAPIEQDNEIVIAQYAVSGGMDTTGRLLSEAEPVGEIKSWRVDREWLRLHVPVYTSIQNLSIVTGFGPSMKGMFNSGDPLLMDRGVNQVDHEGVYFFRVGDEGYIKILQRVPDFDGPGFRLRVISKNEDYPPYDLSPKNPHLRIIGKILTVWKSEQY